MAAYETTRPIYETAPAAGLFQRLIASYLYRRDVKRTERALSALTERELEDIGLCRGDIYEIARTLR